MRSAVLTRLETSGVGTFGLLVTDSEFECKTGELPWRLNEVGKSCIPPGVYLCKMEYSPKHKREVYHVKNVPGRSDVEIHSANYMGDTEQGFKSELLGCVSLGMSVCDIEGQRGVSQSKKAIASFEADMQKADFELTVEWSPGVGPTE